MPLTGSGFQTISGSPILKYWSRAPPPHPLGSANPNPNLYPNIGRVPPFPGKEASTDTRKSTYLGYVHTSSHQIPYSICPGAKIIPDGLLFPHKNGDFGAISETERSRAAPISKVKSHISDRCSCYTDSFSKNYLV